ncbi:hypothetical protein L2744_00140 [Shewanella profunda]|uniref:hypothetical protein n=1 Tax=Shewanella profunda TaxID=254793 RepID=UPI00200C0EB6|nr:hypothetical protein [Shewanella profunda]MCL1088041.1 hypothetical protein [Shewanella profunda]
MPITCPSCQFIREDDQHLDVPEWKCPNCDIVYEKFIKNYNDGAIPASPSTIKPVDQKPPVVSSSEPKKDKPKPSDEQASSQPAPYKPESTRSKAGQFIERHDLGHFVTAKGGLIMLLVFITGFFAGREYFKYEVRQAVVSAFPGLAKPAEQSSIPSTDVKLPEVFTNSKKLPVFLIAKDYRDFDSKLGGDAVTMDIHITNTFDKDITGFNGVLVFKDIIGNEVIRLNIKFTDGIAAGGSVVWQGEMQYNQFIDSIRALRNAEREKLKIELELKKVVFADGTVEEFD